jgi:Zn-finger nucleic acid-binding protein
MTDSVRPTLPADKSATPAPAGAADTAGSLHCPNCGAAAGLESAACTYCHAPLATMSCPTCFNRVFIGAAYCPHCGTRAARQDDGTAAPESCPRCRTKTPMASVHLGAMALAECATCAGVWVDADAFDRLCTDREAQAAVVHGHALRGSPSSGSAAAAAATAAAGGTPAGTAADTAAAGTAPAGAAAAGATAAGAAGAGHAAAGAVRSIHGAAAAGAALPPLEKISYRPCPRCRKMMNRVNFAKYSGVVLDVCRAHGTFFDRDELHRVVMFIQAGGLDRARARDREDLLEAERRLRALQTAAAVAPSSFSTDHSTGPSAFESFVRLLFHGE